MYYMFDAKAGDADGYILRRHWTPTSFRVRLIASVICSVYEIFR